MAQRPKTSARPAQSRRSSPLADPRKRNVAPAGNVLALRHGGDSPRIVETNVPQTVASVRDALREELPYAQPIDTFHLEQLARLIVRIRLLDQYVDRLGGGLVDARGRPRGCASLWVTLVREYRAMAGELGIGPSARARLMGDMAGLEGHRRAQEAQERLQVRHRS